MYYETIIVFKFTQNIFCYIFKDILTFLNKLGSFFFFILNFVIKFKFHKLYKL